MKRTMVYEPCQCESCRQWVAQHGGNREGLICARKAGRAIVSVITKCLSGESFTEDEMGLLSAFETLSRSKFLPPSRRKE